MDHRQFLNTPHLIAVSAILPATVVLDESPSVKASRIQLQSASHGSLSGVIFKQ